MQGVIKNIDLDNNLSLEFYKHLFDAASEGMIVVDERGLIVSANKRVVTLFEYPLDELIGEYINIIIPKDMRAQHTHHVSSYFHKPKPRLMSESDNLMGEKKSGEILPIEISLSHFNNKGSSYAIAMITDISDRVEDHKRIKELNEQLERKVEERTSELQMSQELHIAIARNFPDGTINVLDKELNYIFVEGKELFRLGITGADLVGSNYIDRLPSNISEGIESKLLGVFNGISCCKEISINDNYYELEAVPLTSVSGDIENILVVEKNITLQKNARNEVARSLFKEKELNHMKSQFVSMASHEFRTPLGTMLSSATLIGKYKTEAQQEKREKHIKRIKSSVNNLTRILDDFLSFDKLESGKIVCLPSSFSITELSESICEDMKGLLKDGQDILYSHKGGDELVFLDRQLLKNAILNLLSNAVKYSDEGQEVTFSTSIDNRVLSILIKDEGMGIPSNEQKHLFERFFRAKNAVNIQGTGLGLNIVKKYIDLIQGEIRCDSEENIGTQFLITIPINTKI